MGGAWVQVEKLEAENEGEEMLLDQVTEAVGVPRGPRLRGGEDSWGSGATVGTLGRGVGCGIEFHGWESDLRRKDTFKTVQ